MSGSKADTAVGAWWTNPGLLVNGDPERVFALLDSGTDPDARLAAAVYRASAHVHQGATAQVRRHLLVLDAARFGDRDLAARISAVPVAGEPAARWRVEWSTGTSADSRLRHQWTGHPQAIRAVVTVVLESRPVAVSISRYGLALVCDLATGRQIGDPLHLHVDEVQAAAVAVVDGRSVLLVGGEREEVTICDLVTGRWVGTLPSDWVAAMATAVVDGRPVAVTSGYDGTVRVWDLTTREQLGPAPADHRAPLGAMATAVLEGQAVAVGYCRDGTVRVWDLATGERLGDPMQGLDGGARALATAVVEGRAGGTDLKHGTG
jgi:hypothetical protein